MLTEKRYSFHSKFTFCSENQKSALWIYHWICCDKLDLKFFSSFFSHRNYRFRHSNAFSFFVHFVFRRETWNWSMWYVHGSNSIIPVILMLVNNSTGLVQTTFQATVIWFYISQNVMIHYSQVSGRLTGAKKKMHFWNERCLNVNEMNSLEPRNL